MFQTSVSKQVKL